MTDRPWLKFYPSDWRGSASLKLVSMAARGLWIEMLCIMHEAEPYGHLVHKGRKLEVRDLAALVGSPAEDVTRWLGELTDMGVVDAKKNGVLFSRRLEKDENNRRKASEWGKKGGNPSLGKPEGKSPGVKGSVQGETKPQRPETRDQSLEREINLSQREAFDAFWQAYPKKVGKPVAVKAYAKALQVAPPEAIMAGLNNNRASTDWTRDGGRYIPHPSTWLNRHGWNDHPGSFVDLTAPLPPGWARRPGTGEPYDPLAFI